MEDLNFNKRTRKHLHKETEHFLKDRNYLNEKIKEYLQKGGVITEIEATENDAYNMYMSKNVFYENVSGLDF